MSRQGADGKAHITYYDKRGEGYSYVWDGVSSKIEVCIGGYAEPVDHLIPAVSIWQVDDKDWPDALNQIMEEFEDTCANHTNALLNHDGRVVRDINEVHGNLDFEDRPVVESHHSKFIRQLLTEGPARGQTHL